MMSRSITAVTSARPRPGHAERLLDRHRAAQHEAQEHARDRDDRQERVGQGVAHHDEPSRSPLARAVRTKSSPMTSRRHERDMRAM